MTKRGVTREKLITAAYKVFFENGYEASSVKMILAEADAVTGSFYHFFSSKEELFEAVIERFLAEYAENTNALFQNDSLSLDDLILLSMKQMKAAIDTYDNVLEGNRLHWTVRLSMHERTLAALVHPLAEALQRRIEDNRMENRTGADPLTLAGMIIKGTEAIVHSETEMSYEKKLALVKEYISLLLTEKENQAH